MRINGALPNLRPCDLVMARTSLGMAWGLGRRLSQSEMATVLGFHRKDSYARHEAERGEPTGPMSTAVRAMLAGYRPPNAPRLDLDREAFIHRMAASLDTPVPRVRVAVQNLEARGLIAGPQERRTPLASKAPR